MPRPLKGATGWLERNFYPEYQSEDDLFCEKIDHFLRREHVALDAGCGNGLFKHEYKTQPRLLVGCDLSPEVGRNTTVDVTAMGDLARLPFAGASFDLVLCRYVLEHVSEPSMVFREFGRVLRPGGSLVLLTPNLHHYVALISRFTPHRFHEWIATVRGNQHEDVFPTVYRANTRKTLLRLLADAGLDLVDYLSFEAKPNYLVMSPVAYAIGILYERVVNRLDWLACLRVSIILVARKAAQA